MIYPAKVANRKNHAYEVVEKYRKKKCPVCGDARCFGALDTNPDLIVWCGNCVVLKEFDEEAYRKLQAAGKNGTANPQKL